MSQPSMEAKRRYANSERGRAKRAEWLASEAGKASRKKALDNYYDSDKYHATRARYLTSVAGLRMRMETIIRQRERRAADASRPA